MQVEYIKDPVFSNADSTAITCLVKFAEFAEELPFNASSFDPAPHGREIFARLMAGEFGPIGAFVEFEPVDLDQSQPEVVGAQTL